MTISPTESSLTRRMRLGLVCLAAVSVALPMAWISLAKVLLIVFGLFYLSSNVWVKRSDPAFQALWTPRVVLACLLAFSASLAWTEADLGTALSAYVKHGKLIEMLLLLILIRSAQEARIGVIAFAAGQVFLLLSSWLLFVGLPVPWVTDPIGKYVVFSSYLDQSIILATSAAVFWHLRPQDRWPRWIAITLAALAMINVLLLEGRTGYIVAVAVFSLAVMWAVPRRWRLLTLIVTPLIVLVALYFGSAQVKERLSRGVVESQNFAAQAESASSMGWRLNAWRRSVEAINEMPWLGHGVGSWTTAAKRFEGTTANQTFGVGSNSNPHQEYLLWGVELGVFGTLALILLLVAMLRDAMRFSIGIQQTTISIVAAMAVACMFNSTLYDDLMGDYFCISLGLLMALGMRSASTSAEPAQSSLAQAPTTP